MTRTIRVLACVVGLLLFGGWEPISAADGIEDHLRVVAPAGAKGAPLMVFLQGSAGGNSRALRWAGWLKEKGVASAVIDSAGMRGLEGFFGTMIDYGEDVGAALVVLKGDARVDVSRFGIMGFSRGGSRALTAGKFFQPERSPALVVAMYPGALGSCRQDHAPPTRVVIFYGDKDLWGAFRGTRDACVKLAESEDFVKAHIIPGAHHGYDDTWEGEWSCCGGRFYSKGDPAAFAETKRILAPVLADTILRQAPGP